MDVSSIGIIGAGNWGTTLAIYLDSTGQQICLYEHFKDKARKLKENRINEDYLPGHEIPESIRITSEPEELTDNSSIIFLVQPSHTVRNILKDFKNCLRDNIIASFTKGLDPETLQRISEIIEEELPTLADKVVAVSGPSIAREVIRGVPTSLVAASVNINNAEMVQRLISSERLRVYTSTDIVGVELGGSLKNVYAIASGICDGMALGMNAKAGLITRSMAELSRMGEEMGGEKTTFAGLSGFGDLIVTSFSEHSRNRTVGERLGRGEKLDDILDDMMEVAEGVRTTRSCRKLSKEYSVEMPVAEEVYRILFKDKNPEKSIRDLMSRDLKEEIS